MKTPTWGLVIGILMMFFGGCSIVSDVQSVNMPQILEMQQNVMNGMMADRFKVPDNDSIKTEDVDSVNEEQAVTDQALVFENMSETMSKMLYMSDFTITWIIRFGYIGFMVSFIYILGGVFLLIRKRYSLKLAYGALGLSILFSIIQMIVLSIDSTGGYMSIMTGFSKIFGVIIDIILLIVILSSDKTAYNQPIE